MSPAAAISAVATTLPPPRILLVDDVRDDREMYATFLSCVGGCQVTEAANGPEALAAFERDAPDVVVLDVQLPGIEGSEVCRALRQSAENDRTAVVALTALPMQSAGVDRMIDAGSDAILLKPCAPELLLAEIRHVIQRGANLRQRSISQRERAQELRSRSERLHQRAAQTQQSARDLLQQADCLTLTQYVKATYLDLPGLSITLFQATRLWGFDESTCQRVFDRLISDGFLFRSDDGQYRRSAN